MLLEKEREALVRYGRRMVESGLVKGTGGNLSVFDRERGLFAITPSGIGYDELSPEDCVVMDLEGNVVEGTRKPSSEKDMHRLIYAEREDMDAVVHTHSTYCTVLGTLREGLPASSYLIAFAGPDVRCATYAPYGTEALAENALSAMDGRSAVILANHGLTAGGKTLDEAYALAEIIEECAKVYIIARQTGVPVILPEEEMNDMIRRFKGEYGQK